MSVSVQFSLSMCLDNIIKLGLGSLVAISREKTAHSVTMMILSPYLVILVISHFGFVGGTLVLVIFVNV